MENYFNYYTEVEECFQRCRGSHTRLSPVDWALIEAWKEAGIPLEAVLNGVERTFEKWAKRPRRIRKVNGLGYCSQEVLHAAEELHESVAAGDPLVRSAGKTAPANANGAPFCAAEVEAYLNRNAEAVIKAATLAHETSAAVLSGDLADAAEEIRQMAPVSETRLNSNDFEDLERRLTALEDKVEAALKRAVPLDLLTEFRREVERSIIPYRQRMTGPQIESLERQYLKKRMFEHYGIPRLSLFYL